MFQLIYSAFLCAALLCYSKHAAADSQQAEIQPLPSVSKQNHLMDWKQANEKVAELGGWQFYASQTGSHKSMDHSKHQMPMDHSKHPMPTDHSKHQMPMDHSKHQMPMDHSKHQMPMDHSKHQPTEHKKPGQAKAGEAHEHHH